MCRWERIGYLLLGLWRSEMPEKINQLLHRIREVDELRRLFIDWGHPGKPPFIVEENDIRHPSTLDTYSPRARVILGHDWKYLG